MFCSNLLGHFLYSDNFDIQFVLYLRGACDRCEAEAYQRRSSTSMIDVQSVTQVAKLVRVCRSTKSILPALFHGRWKKQAPHQRRQKGWQEEGW